MGLVAAGKVVRHVDVPRAASHRDPGRPSGDDADSALLLEGDLALLHSAVVERAGVLDLPVRRGALRGVRRAGSEVREPSAGVLRPSAGFDTASR
jgi:hypothetical protein